MTGYLPTKDKEKEPLVSTGKRINGGGGCSNKTVFQN